MSGQELIGPFTLEELREKLEQREIQPETLLKNLNDPDQVTPANNLLRPTDAALSLFDVLQAVKDHQTSQLGQINKESAQEFAHETSVPSLGAPRPFKALLLLFLGLLFTILFLLWNTWTKQGSNLAPGSSETPASNVNSAQTSSLPNSTHTPPLITSMPPDHIARKPAEIQDKKEEPKDNTPLPDPLQPDPGTNPPTEEYIPPNNINDTQVQIPQEAPPQETPPAPAVE